MLCQQQRRCHCYCTTDQDCLNFYWSNSGATCNTTLGQCILPTPNTDCGGNFYAGIKTSSGAGNVFVVRPSLVVGLLTDVTVSSKQVTTTGTVSSSALAGVNVSVSVGAESGSGQPTTIPNFPVTYDARFVQISTNLFQALATQCTNITNGCFLTFAESTVSAHSFDWVVYKPLFRKLRCHSKLELYCRRAGDIRFTDLCGSGQLYSATE